MNGKLIGLSVVFLVVGVGVGYALSLQQISTLQSNVSDLVADYQELEGDFNSLNATYTELKADYDSLIPVTYYTIDERLNITDLEIETSYFYTYIRGNITNISEQPIDNVYVHIILRNSDGTSDYSPYDYDELENLYIGETMEFEILVDMEEGQTFEVLLIY